MSTAANGPKHIPALDGLRGIAVLLVLAVHTDRPVSLKPLLATGWIGVDLFFVLSGFLITRILLSSRESPRYYTNFYARRILRIWPVYLGMLLFVFLCERAGILRNTATLGCWLCLLTFTQNLYVARAGWDWTPDWLRPTWSLGVEEQFYLLWPFLVRRLRLLTLQRFCIAVVLISPILRAWIGAHAANEDLPMLLTVCRLDGLCLGTLLAVALESGHNKVPQVLVRLAVPASAAFFVVNFFGKQFAIDAAGYSLLALASAGVIAACVSPGPHHYPKVHRVLGFAPLRFFGKISYCLYLVHTAAFAIVGSHAGLGLLSRVPGYDPAGWSRVAANWTFAIGISTASWYFYERPILGLKRRFAEDVLSLKTRAAGHS